MGKSKPRNREGKRNDAAGKQVKPPADPELAAIREQRILPALNDLQSAELEKRFSAAKTITNIIEDSKCRKLLLREQIVRILFEQTFTDSSLEIRTAGWGILRNLALAEEADFSIHLYRRDILTAIEGVASNISETIQSEHEPLSQLPKAQQDLVWTLTSSLTNLLSSLSEAQDEIAEAISKLPSIIRFLFCVLLCKTAPIKVHHEALSGLAALTEDNKSLDEEVVANKDWLGRLFAITDGGDLNAVAACGVLHNIFTSLHWFDRSTQVEGASDATLLPILTQSIENARSLSIGSNGHMKYYRPDQILQLALEITGSIATSLQEALEHGDKHEEVFEGFGDDDAINEDGEEMDIEGEDDDEDENEDEDEDDHSMNQEDIDADMELILGDGPDEDDGPIDETTLDRLVRIAAPQVLLLARPFQQDSPESRGISDLALSALNNIAWTVSSIDFSTGHLNGLLKFWSSLAHQTWNEVISPVLASNTADIELASAITSLAWAVSRSLQGVIAIKPEEQRKFMALYQASKTLPTAHSNGSKKSQEEDADAFQSLGVKSIGVLGRLALDPAPVELNREIGIFLITVLAAIPDTPAADAVEALNQIFDIYADKSFACDETVFWANGFDKHLEEVLPKVKKMAKSIDKRKQDELRSRADDAVLNLGRFLQYKRLERKQTS